MILTQERQLKSANHRLLILALFTSALLLFSYLNYTLFRIESTAIGVLHEIMVVSCSIIAQPLILFYSFKSFLRSNYNYKSISFVTFVISLITICAVVISFIQV